MTDPMRGKYVKAFPNAWKVVGERLAQFGGQLEAGVHDYEAFTFTAPGVRLIFYPHRTTAGNYHMRIRPAGKNAPDKLLAVLTALVENSCMFQFPSDLALYQKACAAARSTRPADYFGPPT